MVLSQEGLPCASHFPVGLLYARRAEGRPTRPWLALGFREYDRKVHDRVDGTDTLWYRRDPGDPLPPASP